MSTYGYKIKEDKGAKLLQKVTNLLLPEERVLLICKCNNFKPSTDFILVTNFRLFGLSSINEKVSVEHPYTARFTAVTDGRKETVTVTGQEGQTVFKMVSKHDHDQLTRTLESARAHAQTADVEAAYAEARATPEAQAHAREIRAKSGEWPTTAVVGATLSTKASRAVARQCQGSEPWLILVSSGGAGLLAAWEDRLAIIKTGALTSFMAGSLGGERAASFHFRDITGIEYNSGMVNGVLEVLTASYSGASNKDFWRGSNQSRNSNSDDPWTLSNTLPLGKSEYRQHLAHINELRAKIGSSKETVVHVTVAPPAEISSEAAPAKPGQTSRDLVQQLAELAELRDAGILNDEEFAAAKQRLISG